MNYIEILTETGLLQTILVVMAFLLFVQSIIRLKDWFYERFGIKTKSKLKNEDIINTVKKHDETLTEIKQSLNILTIASRESLAYKINEKYHKYISQGYIPEDEYSEFINLHDAYKGVGGNHTGDEKFQYCIDNLQIKNKE